MTSLYDCILFGKTLQEFCAASKPFTQNTFLVSVHKWCVVLLHWLILYPHIVLQVPALGTAMDINVSEWFFFLVKLFSYELSHY